jgi:hypothetical protein
MAGPGRSIAEVDALAAAILADLRAGSSTALDRLCQQHEKPPPKVIWSPAPDAAIDQRLHDLLAYWRSFAADGLPRWADFRAEEVRPLVGNMVVIDPVDGGRDFRYALYGTGIADVVNRDYQGETTRQMAAHTGTAGPVLYLVLYALALERREAVWSRSAANRWQEVEFWERLVLPVHGRNEGEIRFVVGMAAIGRKALPTGALAERNQVIGEDRSPIGRPTRS